MGFGEKDSCDDFWGYPSVSSNVASWEIPCKSIGGFSIVRFDYQRVTIPGKACELTHMRTTVLVYLPTKWVTCWANVGKYSSSMVRIWVSHRTYADPIFRLQRCSNVVKNVGPLFEIAFSWFM